MSDTEFSGLEIAVIGMAGKFPAADDIQSFWNLLAEGRDGLSHFSREELAEAGVAPQILDDPAYIRSRGIISDEDKFDANFFDLFPREVEMMDPQHRLFLQTCWHGLEDAGYNPFKYSGLIGLFGGVSLNTYLFDMLLSQQSRISPAEGYQLSIGNDKDFLTTRVAYKLNLKGPGVTVQTACSTSLVAIHLACQNLQSYNCDIALAGGVSVTIPQKQGYFYQEGMILSKDGYCRPFDHRASGTVSGSGVGIVVLKRLEDALKDEDHIYAIVRGSAFNNDGAMRVGYTAPSVEGQADVIQTAQSIAGVEADSISYIETHGTGTELGDPIEIKALSEVFREQTARKQFCAIGSVKSNIGHLDAAAGVAGFIKTVLALKHRAIPPSLHFEQANPKIDFENSPFFVNTALRDWENEDYPLRAGVSSFGIGGTNVHVILEEAPQRRAATTHRRHFLIALSAKDQQSLDDLSQQFARHLHAHPETSLAAASFTLLAGREHFNRRRFTIASSITELEQTMRSGDPKKLFSFNTSKESKSIAFMFSGQGSQYAGMGRDLYETEPVYRRHFEECCSIANKFLEEPLEKIILADPQSEAASEKLKQTALTQPALFCVEYALARLLMHWGIQPDVMAGHSIGEYVAACLAGVFSLQDALQVVCLRGRLMQSMPPGAMISLPLDEAGAKRYTGDDIEIATINGPAATVLSGTIPAIEKLEHELKKAGQEYRRLVTSHAFHSHMMEPVLAEFERTVRSLVLSEPRIPYLSNVTGALITNEQAADPAYYARHLRQAVRFGDNLEVLLHDANLLLVEVGPGKALVSLAGRHSANSPGRVHIQTMRHPHEKGGDDAFLFNALGKMWLNGVTPDFDAFFENEPRQRIPLPLYPFLKKRYWYQEKSSQPVFQSGQPEGKTSSIEQWLYRPTWIRSDLLSHDLTLKKNWLIVHQPESKIAPLLKEILQSAGHHVLSVTPDNAFKSINAHEFSLATDNRQHWADFWKKARTTSTMPEVIIDTLMFDYDSDNFAGLQKYGPLSLTAMAQGLQVAASGQRMELLLVTCGLFEISGMEKLQPAKATLLGPARVIPQEFPALRTRVADLDPHQPTKLQLQSLLSEALNDDFQPTVGYRNHHRWICDYTRFEPAKHIESTPAIREGGLYMIIGGLGRIGLQFARLLAEKYQARLLLVDYATIPPRKEWSRIVQDKKNDPDFLRIRQLTEIDKFAKEIIIRQADVSAAEEFMNLVREVEEKFGTIHGVIHSAGRMDESIIRILEQVSGEDFAAQAKSKIEGTLVLDKALEGITPDFVFIQSSLSTILGGLGFSAYAAANHFLDAFVAAKNQSPAATRWVCVNWDGWRFDQESSAGSGQSGDEFTIFPDEGRLVFDRLINSPCRGQIIVSTGNLQQRLQRWIIHPDQEKLAPESDQPQHDRPELMTSFVAPSSDLEKEIADIWQKLLGIKSIGVHDNFFDLGGNSLMGTQLIAKLRQIYQIELPLRTLFEDPTINGVATIIEDNLDQAKNSDLAVVADMMDKINQLSDEEIKQLLEKKKPSDEQN